MKEGAFVFDGPPRDMMSNDVIGAVYDTHFTFVRHPETGFPVIVPEGGVAIT
jgi:ABC-type hemin transport system ATPase subunit